MASIESLIAAHEAKMGDLAEVLKFALDELDDHWERFEFLKAVQDGSVAVSDEWADYRDWLEDQRDDGPWVVMNGAADQFRGWGAYGAIWVNDIKSAIHYARRQDAENVHQEDDDVWFMLTVRNALKKVEERKHGRVETEIPQADTGSSGDGSGGQREGD